MLTEARQLEQQIAANHLTPHAYTKATTLLNGTLRLCSSRSGPRAHEQWTFARCWRDRAVGQIDNTAAPRWKRRNARSEGGLDAEPNHEKEASFAASAFCVQRGTRVWQHGMAVRLSERADCAPS